MNFEQAKKWLPLVIWGAVTWFGCYVIFWLERSSCDRMAALCLRDGFKNWLGDIVMLSWVYQYQTLLAGAFASIAAGAALGAVILQRRFELQNQAHARIERAIGTVGLIQEKFSVLIEDVQRAADGLLSADERRHHLLQVESASATMADLLPSAYSFGAEFGVWYGNASAEVKERLRLSLRAEGNEQVLKLLATLYANRAIVRDYRNLTGADGYYRRAKIRLDADEIAVFQAMGLKVRDVTSARRYLEEI